MKIVTAVNNNCARSRFFPFLAGTRMPAIQFSIVKKPTRNGKIKIPSPTGLYSTTWTIHKIDKFGQYPPPILDLYWSVRTAADQLHVTEAVRTHYRTFVPAAVCSDMQWFRRYRLQTSKNTNHRKSIITL
jgi:hypothetical protein